MIPPALALLTAASAFAWVKVVFGFGLVIFLHEFGHFLMARRNGVFVEKFAIGFDFFNAKLFSWERNGTEYVIGAFPLGGYVKMLGQNDWPPDPDPANRDPRSFQAKSVWQRTQIISAGVIANFLSAFALCYVALVVGYHSYPSEVGSVTVSSLQAGLRPGDVVTSVDGKDISSWEEMVIRFATLEAGTDVELLVDRDGTEHRVIVPVFRDPDFPINTPDFSGPVEMRVGTLAVGLPADLAGMKAGDQLLAVDGEEVEHWGHFQELVRQRPDRPSVITVGRDGERIDLQIHPQSRRPDEVPKHLAGFAPAHPPRFDFVAPESTAWAAGLRPGDVALEVNSHPVSTWYDVYRRTVWDTPVGDAVHFMVDRGGKRVSATVPPGPIADWGLRIQGLAAFGIANEPPDDLVVGSVQPGGPAAKAGLKKGDVISAVSATIGMTEEETRPYEAASPSWELLLMVLNAIEDRKLGLEVQRDGKVHRFELLVEPAGDEVAIGYLGVGPLTLERLVKKGPVEALAFAAVAPFRILKEFVDGIRAMFLRRASTKMLAGPVGIFQASHSFAKKSTGDLFNFLALLSVNLAVVNFLPIPITDGGHFMFLMYEKARGRRMDEDMEARFQWAGLVFILLVFLFATFNDVGRIFDF